MDTPTGFADEEHECDDRIAEAGISKWDSFSGEQKEQALKELKELYYGNDKSNLMRKTYTFEEVKEIFISDMKNTDKNAN